MSIQIFDNSKAKPKDDCGCGLMQFHLLTYEKHLQIGRRLLLHHLTYSTIGNTSLNKL